MHSAVVAFIAPEVGPTAAITALVDLGFEIGPSQAVTRTLLDTFDGRLHRAGVRLELCEGDGLELILSGEDTVRAHLSVASVPRFPDELPPGPFRSRIASLVDVRALLPGVTIMATHTSAAWRDRAEKTVVTATIHEHLRVVGHEHIEIPSWTIEIEELTGYAKRAGKVVAMLERLGLERLNGDTLTAAAQAAGIELAGFSGSPTVPLDPTMPAIDGFRFVLVNLAESIVANWQGTIDRLDPEFLHDLRVAVRRTRSVIGQGKGVVPPEVVEHARQRFAWLGTLTGSARDLDVYLIEWDSYTASLGAEVITALEPVRTLLERRRKAAYAMLALSLQSAEAADLIASWQSWLRDPTNDDQRGTAADRPLGKVVAKRIVRAQSNLVERGRLIHPDTPPEQVHDVRKDAKKVRYLLECFASLLPAAEQRAFVRRLKAFQDTLGEHQDAEVHVAELRALSCEMHDGGAPPDTMLAIGQLIEQLDQRRAAARAAFAEGFSAYDSQSTRRALDVMLHAIGRS